MGNWDSPTDWARAQFGDCGLGDRRLTARLVKMGASMLSRSSASIPKQMRTWADIKGAYRFFGSPKVDHAGICRPHWEATRALARRPGQGLVLFVQDQTELNFGPKADSWELGFVAGTAGRGIEVQTTMCVVPDRSGSDRPEVLGLALQTPWLRTHAPGQKREAAEARTEYDSWEDSVAEIGPAPAPESGTTWVSVGDRASDVFAHLSRATRLGWRCLVRSRHDRRLVDSAGCLHGAVRALEPMGATTLHLRSRPARKGDALRRGRSAQKARTVRLNVSYRRVRISADPASKKAETLELTCVRVWEDPLLCPVADPIEWILLTTLPVGSAADAVRIAELYRHRWLIEEYHKCLKTGCDMEGRSLNHARKLLALLGVLSIVAAFLLQLKTPNPTAAPPDDLVRLVRRMTHAKEDLERPGALLRRIAMLGGFIGRKGDGEPGWQTLWDGWTRVQDVLWGIELARDPRCG